MPIATDDRDQARLNGGEVSLLLDGRFIAPDELNRPRDTACRVALPRLSRPRNRGWGRMSLRGRTRSPGIGPSYRSCNRSEGFLPTRRCTCRMERLDHISGP